MSFWIINDEDNDASCHIKKWLHIDDLAVTVNDAAPWCEVVVLEVKTLVYLFRRSMPTV